MTKVITFIGMVAFASLVLPREQAAAATYFVDATNGNDANNGLGESSAWKTLSKVNGETFVAGDSVLLKRGELWREALNLGRPSGSAGSVITVGAYSTGDRPIISGHVLQATWTLDAGNIWQSTLTVEPKMVFLDRRFGDKKASKAACVNADDWYWEGGATDKLYIFSTSDPDTAFTSPGIEHSASGSGAIGRLMYFATGNSVISHWLINDIELRGAHTNVVECSNNCSNLTFRRCRFTEAQGHGWHSASATDPGTTNLVFEDCEFDHNGRIGLSFSSRVVGADVKNCTFHHNALRGDGSSLGGGFRGVPITASERNIDDILVENCKSYSNGKDDNGTVVTVTGSGRGIWFDTFKNSICRYNTVYDNARQGIHIESNDNADVYYNLSYSNDFDGLVVSTGPVAFHTENCSVWNNTVYGNGRYGLWLYGVDGSGVDNIHDNDIQNNISVGNTSENLRAEQGANNVIGSEGSGSNNVYTHNCFDIEATGFIRWGSTAYDSYDAWEAAPGGPGDARSVEADPLFADEANVVFYLTSTSPCMDAGLDVGLTQDLDGELIICPPDVGAFEAPAWFHLDLP